MFTTSSILLMLLMLFVAALLVICSPYLKKPKAAKPLLSDGSEKLPPVSIIVSAFDNPVGVLDNLPVILNQKYESDFEVILVVDSVKIKEEDYKYQLEQLENYDRLRVTYVPDSSHYMGHQKLAVTLGVKAAKHDWIMLTDAHCVPIGDRWLHAMARNCYGNDFVLGYSNINFTRYDFRKFERLVWQLYTLFQAERLTAYSCADGNMMFRKSIFMSDKGYSGNLKYTYGEYEFLINKYAQTGKTAVETAPEAWCIRHDYTEREWDRTHLCFQETRRHLQRGWTHRLLVGIDQAVLHLSFPIFICLYTVCITNSNWAALIFGLVAFACGLALREYFAKRMMRRFQVRMLKRFVTPMELSLLWQHATYLLRYLFTDKTEFISHKF